MAWNLDLNNQSVKQVENATGALPEGYYRVKVSDAKEMPEDGAMVMKFSVCHGPDTGRVQSERLGNPQYSDSEKAKAMQIKRAVLFAVRLGLIGKDDSKVANIDWSGAVGKEVIIRTKHRTYTKTDGSEGETVSVDFAGIWPLDHADLLKFKNDIRASVGLPTIAGNDGPSLKPSRNGTPPAVPAGAVKTTDEIAAAMWK